MRVGLRTNDGLNIHIADDGLYHFTFYERGKLGFDRAGSLDDYSASTAKALSQVKPPNW
jgi:hypothetical protein